MGVLDKLAFWKKKDDFNFDQGADPFAGSGGDPLGGDPLANPSPGAADPLAGGQDPFASPDALGGAPEAVAGSQDPLANPLPGGDPLAKAADPFAGSGNPADPFARESPPGAPSSMQQPFTAQQPQETHHAELYGKDLEVVSAKLDSIRYTLESMNQRLQSLERIAHGEHPINKDW